ncbi:MAG: protein-glutamate O-methyltransferase [Methylomonas sp.]|jgi:chemotaxis protein methyltransferase CheR
MPVSTPLIVAPSLQKHEFDWIKDYLYKQAGIVLNDSKRPMVMGRLEKRLRHLQLSSYGEYFALLGRPGYEQETTIAIDLLTTNETYFFRESKHFDFFVEKILPAQAPAQPFRVWSAASSSGEEAYTLAMLIDHYGRLPQWEILGTDISSRMLEKARAGLYQAGAADKIPANFLKKYCLKGSGGYDGFLLVDPALRKKVQFAYANLTAALPDFGRFDVIFLRNVMIYFDAPTKQKLLERILRCLRPGGHFIISHSESLNGFKTDLQLIIPSVYRKKTPSDIGKS